MKEPNDELTPPERSAIESLSHEAALPPGSEDAAVAALAARGLLGRRTSRPIWPAVARIGLAVAASAILFAGGILVGRRSAPPAEPVEQPRFALLLFEGPEYDPAPVGREAERVREYSAWARARGASGEIEGGEKLRDIGGTVIGTDGSVAAEPVRPGESRLAGFFLIRAADGRSALEIARSCPHVRYGGSIVIREIESTSTS